MAQQETKQQQPGSETYDGGSTMIGAQSEVLGRFQQALVTYIRALDSAWAQIRRASETAFTQYIRDVRETQQGAFIPMGQLGGYGPMGQLGGYGPMGQSPMGQGWLGQSWLGAMGQMPMVQGSVGAQGSVASVSGQAGAQGSMGAQGTTTSQAGQTTQGTQGAQGAGSQQMMLKTPEQALRTYVQALRQAWTESQKKFAEAFRTFVKAQQDAMAKIDVQQVDPITLATVGQVIAVGSQYGSITIGSLELFASASGVDPQILQLVRWS